MFIQVKKYQKKTNDKRKKLTHYTLKITLIDYVRVGRQLNILKDEYTKVVITK